ncbi:MAG: TonB-dependent receptor plug domain-containing protein, partial [Woeseia sp.]|nr:TonB-dependent receptor plug domain-containing protein [Woeseia sp.]
MKIISTLECQLVILCGALLLALSPELKAQEGADAAGLVLDEITVSARRRDENLQDVPIAVQAFSSEDLEIAGIKDFSEVVGRTPGMIFSTGSGVDHEIFIRGIGSDIQGAAADNPVGIFVDGVFMSRSSGTNIGLYDLERVEVLKGPQSLRFGKNIVGGLIHYVTKKPSQELEGSTDITVGDYNQLDVSGAIRGPISDTVSFSLAGSSNNHDGYGKNTLGGPDAEDLQRQAVRGHLLFEPSDDLSILLSADYNRNRSTGRWNDIDIAGDSEAVTFNGFFAPPIPQLPGFVLPNRNQPFRNTDRRSGPRNFVGSHSGDISGLSATINWTTDNGLDLQSITAFRDTDLTYYDDGCGVNWDHPLRPAGNDGLLIPDASASIIGDVDTYLNEVSDCWFHVLKKDNSQQFSQELRVSGGNDRTTWSVGGYYLSEDIERDENIAYSFPDFNVITDWAFSIAFGGAPGGAVQTEGLSEAKTLADST